MSVRVRVRERVRVCVCVCVFVFVCLRVHARTCPWLVNLGWAGEFRLVIKWQPKMEHGGDPAVHLLTVSSTGIAVSGVNQVESVSCLLVVKSVTSTPSPPQVLLSPV